MSGSIWLFVIYVFMGILTETMACLITYSEYIHHYEDKKRPRQIAFQTATFTFIFFFLLSLGVSYFLTKFIL